MIGFAKLAITAQKHTSAYLKSFHLEGGICVETISQHTELDICCDRNSHADYGNRSSRKFYVP